MIASYIVKQRSCIGKTLSIGYAVFQLWKATLFYLGQLYCGFGKLGPHFSL